MKKIILVLPLLFILVDPSGSWGQPSCNTFTITNSSSFAPGGIIIGDGNGDATSVDVTSQGNFDTTICYTALWVEVNGQYVSYPNSQAVQLSDGSYITVTWHSTTWIELGDKVTNNTTIH